MMTPAEYIRQHDLGYAGVRGGVVEQRANTLIVCGAWHSRTTGRFGWCIQVLPNSMRAAREWLGY